jgi:hypothetical protein
MWTIEDILSRLRVVQITMISSKILKGKYDRYPKFSIVGTACLLSDLMGVMISLM